MDFVFVAPPLTIDEAQINEALNALDDVLTYTDGVIAGRRTDCRSQHGIEVFTVEWVMRRRAAGGGGLAAG